eukprot:TRINITY_DN52944_c0_g1_i7.p1 TRINITY_DN52944_c0_g1~~TRINITY_DN52944_c0_g1_i7.p1  ORF type:complete len:239 (-),score=12.54 TRINITY_DN52944_c0_g1_i7:32-748(-)
MYETKSLSYTFDIKPLILHVKKEKGMCTNFFSGNLKSLSMSLLPSRAFDSVPVSEIFCQQPSPDTEQRALFTVAFTLTWLSSRSARESSASPQLTNGTANSGVTTDFEPSLKAHSGRPNSYLTSTRLFLLFRPNCTLSMIRWSNTRVALFPSARAFLRCGMSRFLTPLTRSVKSSPMNRFVPCSDYRHIHTCSPLFAWTKPRKQSQLGKTLTWMNCWSKKNTQKNNNRISQIKEKITN